LDSAFEFIDEIRRNKILVMSPSIGRQLCFKTNQHRYDKRIGNGLYRIIKPTTDATEAG